MFFTPILDIALTLVFLYFIMSLISSAVNEIMVNLLNFRSKNLQSAIENLLFDANWKDIADKIINSPFIKALQKDSKSFPANIPSPVFASAFLHAVEDVHKLSLDSAVENLKLPAILSNSETGRLIQSIITNADGDIKKAQKFVEDFFNSAMGELTVIYRKNVKYFTFGFALVVSLILNIDTINVVNNLWHNPVAREQAAAQITATLKENNDLFSSIKKDSTNQIVITNIDSIKANITKIGKADSILTSIPLPIGWEAGHYFEVDGGFMAWIVKLLGILVTAIAIMMGAPFWFDVLNKIAGLKASAKKE